jgi:aminoglycoside phosphotransferase (APT) family kinase protein
MMWSPGLDRAPSRQALQRWCDIALPGWRPVTVRRLRGGLDTAMHAVDLLGPAGERWRVVLKRFDPLHTSRGVRVACSTMWQALAAVERLGLPAPRPIWHDAEGQVFGTAALVMTRVPGRVEWNPPNPRVDRQLAPLQRDPSLLDSHPDGAALRDTLLRLRPHVRCERPVLIHGDLHPGNVLWRRGRLQAVVDWDDTAIGDPGADIGLCRMALAIQHSPDAAVDFLRAYEAAMGRPVRDLVFWDLLAASLAIRYHHLWVASMHAFGRRDITAADLRHRLDIFITEALARR